MGRVKLKSAFKRAQKAQIKIILRMPNVSRGPFALHSYILVYPWILLTDSEGPDQTARLRSLIWTFAVRICPKTRFRIARPIYCVRKKNDVC